MGYNTNYTLEWDSEPGIANPEFQKLIAEVGERHAANLVANGLTSIRPEISFHHRFIEWLEGHDDAKVAIGIDGASGESTKWYDWKDDLKDLSKTFPTVLFTLSGEGADNDDLWKAYALDGTIQHVVAEITFAPCTLRDEAKS